MARRYETIEDLNRAMHANRNICQRFMTKDFYNAEKDRILFREKAARLEARRIADGWVLALSSFKP